MLEAIHKISDREIKAGRMIDNGRPDCRLQTGARVRIADGELSVIDGPFVEAKEVIGGYADLRAGATRTKPWPMAKEFMQPHSTTCPVGTGRVSGRAFATAGRGRGLRGRFCGQGQPPTLMDGQSDPVGGRPRPPTLIESSATIRATWPIEQPRLIATLSRMTAARRAACEEMTRTRWLRRWRPVQLGVPQNPSVG